MKIKKTIKTKHRKRTYYKQRITTKDFYGKRHIMSELLIKLFLNKFNLKFSEFIHSDKIKNLIENRLKHKYLNTTCTQAGNYPNRNKRFDYQLLIRKCIQKILDSK